MEDKLQAAVQGPMRLVPATLRGAVRARVALNHFHARCKHRKARLAGLQIRSLRNQVAGKEIQADNLAVALLPLSEMIAGVVNLSPDSALYLSVPEHEIQVAIPAAWLYHLSVHLTPLTHPMMRVSPQGKA